MNSLAVGDPQSAFQVNGSNIVANSITTGKIDNGAIINDDINISAAIDGTKVNPSFGSQNISTSGSLHITNKLQTTTDGTVFSGTDYGFGVQPNLNSNAATGGLFIAIGDNDTGIRHESDGKLQMWSNDVEIVQFNVSDGITTDKPIVTTSNLNAHHGNFSGELFMGSTGTADASKALDVQIGSAGQFVIRRTDGGDTHSPERIIAGFSYSQNGGSNSVPSGKITAGSFKGDGSELTSLNPANFANGTLPAGVTGAAFTNKPAWYLHSPTAQNIPHNSWTAITGYQTDESGTYSENGVNAANGSFTIPANRAGFYAIFGGVSVVNLDAPDVLIMQFYKNGTLLGPEHKDYSPTANQTLTTSGMRFGNFAVGDVIQVAVYHNEGGSRNTDGSKCYFGGFRLLT